ncbi:MAG: hypothetical protein WC865_18650, partial [Bacteroidales bacterium]
LKVQSSISDIAVPLAIPLLLFSLDFRKWVKLARTTFLSMLTAVAGALKNKEVIISGITVGLIGYAIGNYLGEHYHTFSAL